jgi:Tol biopolymer transport system component
MRDVMKRLMLGAIAVSALSLGACGTENNGMPQVSVLSPEGAQHSSLSVSPDGKHVAYWEPAGETEGEFQLWMANTDLTSPVKLPVLGLNIPVAWSKDGTKLLATALEGFGKVVVLPVSGGQAKRVTPGTAYQNHIMFHPDGDRILYVEFKPGGTFGLGVVSLATGERRDAIPGEQLPHLGAWSPDGKHIGYMVVNHGRTTIWVADADGSNPRQLTSEGFESASQPWTNMWSPDSKEIVYESTRTGNEDLWVVPIDGGKPRQLTHDVRKDLHASWSSDGQWIAFTSDRGHQVDVWAVPSHGGQEVRVTDDLATEDMQFGAPQWLPNTHTLLFSAATTSRSLWSTKSDGTGAARLSGDSDQVGALAVSPDGKQVAFVNVHPGNIHDLSVMPVSGGAARVLVAGGGNVLEPAWSSDGKYLAYRSDREGKSHVFIIPSVGGTPKRVSSGPEPENSATWSGTDTSLFFLSSKDTRFGDVWQAFPGTSEPHRVTHYGSLAGIGSRQGNSTLIGGAVDIRTGTVGLFQIKSDGSLSPIWDRSNIFAGPIAPKGDSIIAMVPQPGGSFMPMMLGLNGGEGRPVGALNQAFIDWSNDGRLATYQIRKNGKRQIGVTDLKRGSSRLLAPGTDDQTDAYFTPDGSRIFYRVENTSVRIKKTDLTGALKATEKK